MKEGMLTEDYLDSIGLPKDPTCETRLPRHEMELMRRRSHCVNLPSAIERHEDWVERRAEQMRLREEKKEERRKRGEERARKEEEKRAVKAHTERVYNEYIEGVKAGSRAAVPWDNDWMCSVCQSLYSVWENNKPSTLVGKKTWYEWVTCKKCNHRLCGKCKRVEKLSDHMSHCTGPDLGRAHRLKPKRPK
mmetsp:Transcript_17130/g.23973  ORF Transcript_17130/g.23973 Transcript_17130/m.23973 type:complete len:191 (-) Transcript_17130:74-646(-)